MPRTATKPSNRAPARRFPSLWTQEEDKILRRMYRAGRSDPEIAARLDRSPSSVDNRRQHLGLIKEGPGHPSTADIKERAKPKPACNKPDLWQLWDARNTALRERLRARGELTD